MVCILHRTVESDMDQLVERMDEVICNADDQATIDKVGAAVQTRMSEFPLFADAVTA